MRSREVLALLAEAERKHALEREAWASERSYLLDRIMTLADKPMPEPWVAPPEPEEEDVVDPHTDDFLDELAPLRQR